MEKNNSSVEFLLSVLTEDEKVAVEQLASNKTLMSALKKILLEKVMLQGHMPIAGQEYKNRNFIFGLDPSGMMTDQDFGRAVRCSTEALFIVETTFKTLSEIGTVKETGETTEKNPAR